jgi:hypothetical protein
MLYYYIRTLCGKDAQTSDPIDLVLSVDPSNTEAGDLFVCTKNTNDRTQLWMPVELFDNSSDSVGMLLVNAESGNVAVSPENGGDDAFVGQMGIADALKHPEETAWGVDRNTIPIGGKSVDCTAIRSFSTWSRNLNVRRGKDGAQSGTPVIVYNWSTDDDGHPQKNEVWTFEPVVQ